MKLVASVIVHDEHETACSVCGRATRHNGRSSTRCRSCARKHTAAVKRTSGERATRADLGVVAERFWKKVKCGRAEECWPWTAARDPDGYGIFAIRYLRPGPFKAHRVAYALATKSGLDSDLFVCHTCDNPPCCNPDHLFLGTAKDNAEDAARKGRFVSGEAHWMKTNPATAWGGKREVHGAARLTAEQVLTIRAAVAQGDGITDVARRFGVSKGNVYSIVQRRTWKHV